MATSRFAADSQYRISTFCGKVFDVYHRSVAPGSAVVQHSDNGGGNQRFLLFSDGNISDAYKIKAKQSKLYMAISQKGLLVQVNEKEADLFHIIPSEYDSTHYEIKISSNQYNNLYLDVRHAKLEDGTPVQAMTRNHTEAQQFRIEPVTPMANALALYNYMQRKEKSIFSFFITHPSPQFLFPWTAVFSELREIYDTFSGSTSSSHTLPPFPESEKVTALTRAKFILQHIEHLEATFSTHSYREEKQDGIGTSEYFILLHEMITLVLQRQRAYFIYARVL